MAAQQAAARLKECKLENVRLKYAAHDLPFMRHRFLVLPTREKRAGRGLRALLSAVVCLVGSHNETQQCGTPTLTCRRMLHVLHQLLHAQSADRRIVRLGPFLDENLQRQ